MGTLKRRIIESMEPKEEPPMSRPRKETVMETKDYSLTCREVIDNLLMLADAYEKASAGKAPNGFAFNPTDAAANMEAAVYFIHSFGQQIPQWIPVKERLPVDIPHGYCLVTDGENVGTANYSVESQCFDHCIDRDYWKPTHWMALPEPTEVT